LASGGLCRDVAAQDFGKPWQALPTSPGKPLFPKPGEYLGPVKMGAPHFVDFGKNMEHSPDGKAYLLGMGAEIDDPMPRACLKPGPPGTLPEVIENCENGVNLKFNPPGGRCGLCLHEVRLLRPTDKWPTANKTLRTTR
jgi:hypothetical protein